MRTLRMLMREEGLSRGDVMDALGISESTMNRNLDQDWSDASADWKARLALWCAGQLEFQGQLVVCESPAARYRLRLASAVALGARIVALGDGADLTQLTENVMDHTDVGETGETPLTDPGPREYVTLMNTQTDALAAQDDTKIPARVWMRPSFKEDAMARAREEGVSLSELVELAIRDRIGRKLAQGA